MSKTTYLSVDDAARRLGLPAAWLRREVKAGRLPHIRAGRRLRVDPDAIDKALAARAEAKIEAQAEGGPGDG